MNEIIVPAVISIIIALFGYYKATSVSKQEFADRISDEVDQMYFNSGN